MSERRSAGESRVRSPHDRLSLRGGQVRYLRLSLCRRNLFAALFLFCSQGVRAELAGISVELSSLGVKLPKSVATRPRNHHNCDTP